MDLFSVPDSPSSSSARSQKAADERRANPRAPLAARLRPRTLDEVHGQEHLLGPGKPLRRLIEADRLTSILLFGPPGVGKTSLAEAIAASTQSRFERLNAVEATVATLRQALAAADLRFRQGGTRTLLFIDEIHRFNKSQQDVLLPDVESGAVCLIGATTHNPSFYVNGPLVSRSQVFALEPLPEETLSVLIDRALTDKERGLGTLPIDLDPAARAHLIHVSEGDARRLLNALELAALSTPPLKTGEKAGRIVVDLAAIEACVQRKVPVYDKDEDGHYDTISAFIKSVRGSDPDSAIYWLAKMLVAGEDPRFIARRLVILSAEDIGMADPRAISVAVAAQQAFESLGMPEGRIPLAEATVYLATAPKSNAAYMALNAAMEAVKTESTVAIPKALRDAHYKGAEALGHGKGYQYSHDYEGAISGTEFGVAPGTFYTPTGRGYEKIVKERLDYWLDLKKQRREE
ncbi:putative ATPase [Verrucomicrobium sp. GAS474]|uniref:replication-associated recombination protein A n=1 Tax=Verrucomicrobium sp. GAS474 TaxID=1882831 RepID=UPI00087CCDD4|nr:replication-associated recombination protein A [Verrucomicrobium sp. GAS474]SDT93432.1 putative ATPase [Verrucomicrobium sp. GAS474]